MWPWELGRGPTRSRWMWENLRTGIGISSTGDLLCLVILDDWHFRHVEAHLLMSVFIPDHRKARVISRFVARTPGWCNPCTESKT